jgi:hypothetical protein
MQSKAKTVDEYLSELPPERREAISAVRDVVRENLDKDIAEGIIYGMIGWYIPHSVFPAGYHVNPKLPLPYAALASQKNYMSLYLMTEYMDGSDSADWFHSEWKKAGKKLDMGKSCIRFRKLDDLALEVIGKAIKRTTAQKHVANYLAANNRKSSRRT